MKQNRTRKVGTRTMQAKTMTLITLAIVAVVFLAYAEAPRVARYWLYRSAVRGDARSLARLDQMRTPMSDYYLELVADQPSVSESIRSQAMNLLVARTNTQMSICWDLDQGSGGLDARGTVILMGALLLRGDTVSRECVQILLHRLIASGDQTDPSLSGNLQFSSDAEVSQAAVLRRNQDKVVEILQGTYGLGQAYPNPEVYQIIAGLRLAGSCSLIQRSVDVMRAASSPFTEQYSHLERSLCEMK